MNERTRFREALLFGNPDKIPLQPGGPRESTLKIWRRQGLPQDIDYYPFLLETIGIELPQKKEQLGLDVSFVMIPAFEEKVLAHKNGHFIVQDWMGAITEISDEFDYTYIRSARDFVTRKWHKFPVQNRDDWEQMKWRYNPDHPERFPIDFEQHCQRMKQRDYVVTFQVNGPFWQLREWLGFENLCLLMLDDPAFIHEMINFWTDFVAQVMEKMFRHVQVDRVGISEDMAYKCFSMISPAMVREFLLPTYRRWLPIIQSSGCPIIDMDSDGYIGELIPLWVETGINICDPIEVAAGNDIVAYREQFGKSMAFTGGIDKRAIAKGGTVMREELLRIIPPLLKEGGFIPGCDHGVPPDISWPDFMAYTRLLAELTGWL